jgi:hypothetical protein
MKKGKITKVLLAGLIAAGMAALLVVGCSTNLDDVGVIRAASGGWTEDEAAKAGDVEGLNSTQNTTTEGNKNLGAHDNTNDVGGADCYHDHLSPAGVTKKHTRSRE